MDILMADIRRYVHDERRISARLIKKLKIQTGVDEELLTIVLCSVLSSYLLIGKEARFVANFILIIIPILFTYYFINECPSIESLHLHWSLFGLSILLEDMLGNSLQSYYFLKIVMFLLLYLKPFDYSKKLLTYIKTQSNEGFNALKISPSSSTESCTTNRTNETSSSFLLKLEEAMFKDKRHALTPQSLTTDNSNYDVMDSIHPQMTTLNDLLFEPSNKLVFNGPYDEYTITYYMSVYSKSSNNIAFAIKGNAIPRITVIPPYGIIKPKAKQILAVTIQKFDYESEKDKLENDRIAFDYVLCGPEIEKFSYKLLQEAGMRRRKNISIIYNP